MHWPFEPQKQVLTKRGLCLLRTTETRDNKMGFAILAYILNVYPTVLLISGRWSWLCRATWPIQSFRLKFMSNVHTRLSP